jgi:hypothetical protein
MATIFVIFDTRYISCKIKVGVFMICLYTNFHNFSSIEFSLFNSIKSITSLKDLLDIEQVIVLYMYRFLCKKMQFAK